MRVFVAWAISAFLVEVACAGERHTGVRIPDLPDCQIVEAYEHAATQNVLAAVNPKVFPGYWSVCADGVGFGYANTLRPRSEHTSGQRVHVAGLPAPNECRDLRSHPIHLGLRTREKSLAATARSDAETSARNPSWLSRRRPVRGTRVRPSSGGHPGTEIYRYTQDREWLLKQLPSVNLAADFLVSLTSDKGAVQGAGYYIERPTRVEYDGVAQCHAVDAFRRVSALNTLVGNNAARRYQELADRIAAHFRNTFWVKDRFAEYIHPQRGLITKHGLTDVDWSAIATCVASAEQTAVLWPQLKDEKRFYYGGMPTGIATLPETYESWEFTHNDRMDLAAMGRVWYLECWARARMGDGKGLVESIRKVCQVGKQNGYYWRERYTEKGGHGVEKYCEYPANLIRVVQRFLLGVEFCLDGTLQLTPTAPDEFWSAGFGQTLTWRRRTLSYRMQAERMTADYCGEGSQQLYVRFPQSAQKATARVTINGHSAEATVEGGKWVIQLPAAPIERPCHLEVRTTSQASHVGTADNRRPPSRRSGIVALADQD